jgi:ketosteroid isomerase-like protein
MNMVASSPEHAVELLDKAFNEGDVKTVLGFYEEQAVLISEPGRVARGTEEIGRFLEGAMGTGSSARQLKTHVIEADGVALFLSLWTLHVGDADSTGSPRTFVATTVFRKRPNGGWKALIDNPFGPLVLGPSSGDFP